MKKHTKKRTQGMNWIRQEKRLAIYLRDGLCCAYCGRGIEDGDVTLTLDHIKPYSSGGSNSESNLVTCCRHCNSSRQTRSLRGFAAAVAEYTLRPAAEIVKFINNTRKKSLKPYMVEAKELIARRGSCAAAVESL